MPEYMYYPYVYLEITVSCYQHGSYYFLLTQCRHIPKGSDIQSMVRRNQHIVAALLLAVNMNECLFYDLSGDELKRQQWLAF